MTKTRHHTTNTMHRRHSQIASYIVALVLVFVVGILVGRGWCAPEPEPSDEPDCPPQSPRVVEYCPEPTEDDEPAEPSPSPDPQPEATETESLPDAPPPVDARQRRQLLSWARDRSSTLEGCPRDLGDTYRLAVTIELDDDQRVDDVSISSDDDLPIPFESCIVDRISEWELPNELEAPGRELFFRLTL